MSSWRCWYTLRDAILLPTRWAFITSFFHPSAMAIHSKTGRASCAASPSQLHYADSSDPDMRYLSGVQVPDPFLAFTVSGRKVGVVSVNEFNRVRQDSILDEVLLLSDVEAEAARRFSLPKGRRPGTVQVVSHLAECYGIEKFQVGPRFSAGLYTNLRKAGIAVEVDAEGELLPERQIKTADELRLLRKANRASAAGFREVTSILTKARISKGLLIYNGQKLTSEYLRKRISHVCLEHDAVAMHTIVAAGDQACDSHCVGHGPIRAGELIVVDIFPQRIEDGYWGDMTRTYLKGRASDAQRRLVRTVKKAHELAIRMIKPGVSGGRVHQAVQDFFTREGYETRRNAKPVGFFHALGHAVGLEIHEEPVMRAGAKFRLRKGMVMAVEPGLYYPGLGGARIEDVVHVVTGGCEKISSAPYQWEIA